MNIAAVVVSAIMVLWYQGINMSEYSGESVISIIAKSILYLTLLFVYYLLGKIYSIHWTEITGKTLLSSLTEKIIVPAVCVFSIIDIKNFEKNIESGFFVVSLLLLAIFLVDIKSHVREFISERFQHVGIHDMRVMYLKYPPKDRADIIPMDIAFYGAMIFLLIKKF